MGSSYRVLIVAATSTILASTFGGCGGTLSSNPDNTPPDEAFEVKPVVFESTEVTNWSNALATAICNRAKRCHGLYGTPADAFGYARGMECVAYFTGYLNTSYDVPKAIKNGFLQWNAKAFGQCLTNYAAALCTSEEHIITGSGWACMSVVAGRSQGESCLYDGECNNGQVCRYACDSQSESCVKTCEERRIYNEYDLESVNDSTDLCETIYGSEDGNCNADKYGDTCDTDPYEGDGCAWGLYCAYTEDSDFTGECRPNAKTSVGENKACDEQSQYTPYRFCGSGLVCSAVPNQTNPNKLDRRCLKQVKLGGTCLRDDLVSGSICGLEAYCDAENPNQVGTCTMRRALGESCDPNNPRSCLLGATCLADTSVCEKVSYKKNGEACSSDAECYVSCNKENGVCN